MVCTSTCQQGEFPTAFVGESRSQKRGFVSRSTTTRFAVKGLSGGRGLSLGRRDLGRWLLGCLLLVACLSQVTDVAKADAPVEPPSVEQLVTMVKPAVVTIRHTGRGERDTGLGTGFVISADGLIATNLHVIGEARPISVELADGRTFPVTEVHASDRGADLAIVRIDAAGLQPLKLAAGQQLADGQEVVAIGNPHGLERSVVTGRVSGQREIDGVEMIQLAIPIESGNSGGPLLDRTGRVHGILTLKSLVTRNLGFAVTVDRLQPLLESPNPVVMDRWLTIGALDPAEWTIVGGGRWRQRAGRLSAAGTGSGFGGRCLCLDAGDPPAVPYELAVRVKLEDESGAAGLTFAADGEDRHYGFYPSNGRLRLTRFNGPNVYTWKVLEEIDTPAYRPGEWNHLRVRVETDTIRCYVNDELVVTSSDRGFRDGRVGLAAFRGTEAAFRGYVNGPEVPQLMPPESLRTRIATATASLPTVQPPTAAMLDELAAVGPGALAALELQAVELERRSAQLRDLAELVHHRQTLKAFAEATAGQEEAIDLFRASGLIAMLDNSELDVEACCAEFETLAASIRSRLPADADDAGKIAMLDRVLFSELGFHGSRGDYYNRSNSYINEVVDDREGIPITLSVVYMELAGRLGLKVQGIGFPGHFIVRFDPAEGEPEWIDVFERGRRLSRDDLARRLAENSGESLTESHLAVAPTRAILARMLNNLLGIAMREDDPPAMLRYLDAMLTVEPDSARTRVLRMLTARRLDRIEVTLADARWLLENQPADIDLALVRQLVESLEAER